MSRSRFGAVALVACVCLLASVGFGQGVPIEAPDKGQAIEPPPTLNAVLEALDLPYLTDDERADLRVFHGLWLESDLDTPERTARAALMVGILDHPALDDPATGVELRAEARFRRGDLGEALELLEGVESLRARRLRAQTLEELGRFREASREIERLVDSIDVAQLASAEAATELARALVIRARLEGEPAAYYQDVIRLLSDAHQKFDRLYWPALLVEAELLFSKDNAKEGTEAIIDVLSRNPSCAEAWAMLGTWNVKTFNFENAVKVADRLDRLMRRVEGEAAAPSPYAEMIRARARLKQDDPEQAETYLAGTLDRFPRLREALAIRCAIEAIEYDPESIERMLARYDELSPGSPRALFEVGTALSQDRQYDLASEYLNRAHDRQPKWAEPIVELGLLELQSGRDMLALKALQRAVELDPFHKRAGNSYKLIKELVTWSTVESEHFKVRYKPGEDEVLAHEMLGPLEEIHSVVGGAYGFEPAQKTVIELMPNHQWFAVRITGEPHVFTFAAATGPVVALEAPRIGKQHTNIYDWVRVIRHEYTHTATLAITNNRIPHWFTEAAAVYMEDAPRDYSRCRQLAYALRGGELFDFEEINIAFVRPKRPNDRALAYAQAHWMYEYMVERWGPQAPLEIMAGYKRGEREGSLIESVLGLTPERFLVEFKSWAAGRVREWGLDPSPSLDEMRFEETMADPVLADKAHASMDEYMRGLGRAALIGGEADPFAMEMIDVSPELIEFWSITHPDHPDILAQRIAQELSLNGGEASEAMIPLLERYAAARPVDDMPHRQLARLYLASGEAGKAIPHLEYLDVREVNSDAYAIELAKRYADLGEWALATEKAERATSIAPYDPSNRELAARVAIARRDLDTAERHIRALTVLEPNQSRHQKRLEALESLRSGGGAEG